MAPTMPSTSASPVTILAYLRTQSSIDYDSLDPKVAEALGPFEDCTSNQWEAYCQMSDPNNAELVGKCLGIAQQSRGEFQEVSIEELTVEIAMITLSLRMVPLITGSIHVMCNPLYSWDIEKVYETGHRFHRLCQKLERSFDTSRLIMKVPATWAGLQACKKLSREGIKTLATTLFTMEQVVLAGEAGCISISPFAYELRAHDDNTYQDPNPILPLFWQAQQYYRQHGIPTKIKSCAFMTTDEVVSMAGIDAMTLPAEVLQELATTTDQTENLQARSVFLHPRIPAETGRVSPRLSYINDKAKFDRAYACNGRGLAKTEDSIAVFCKFQIQAEELVAGMRRTVSKL